MLTSICNDWEFVKTCTDEFLRDKNYRSSDIEQIRIPHTVAEMPLQYADSDTYQMISGYRKLLKIDPRLGMSYRIRFEGAAHIAEVFAGGVLVGRHACGYTSFTIDISDYIQDGECLLAVRLDSRENPDIPPFGFVIDYLTFGGIYRPVWLEEVPETHIEDVFINTPDLSLADISVRIWAPGNSKYSAKSATDSPASMLHLAVSSDNGLVLHSKKDFAAKTSERSSDESGESCCTLNEQFSLENVRPWTTDDPFLYTLTVSLCDASGAVLDSRSVRFGVRTAEFKADGFYLNGVKTFLRGLNRHQCYPYVGYAATKSLQRLDAEILKDELRVNAVRTSHYPQSQDFIDACDELGLLVFTEIPGWQHIGDAKAWRVQAIENTKEMVLQYRNHPSVILWGVRINESVDCDELYTKTNELAHRLDPSRATSGVRYIEKSHLLEDVYAFNDFSYAGKGLAAKKRSKVSPDKNKAFLISECNGHMFPTKPWDRWERREEQALRHAQVMNDAMADGGHTGCFEWCMFDYPTHKDFGSGDRVCYHGVLDYFRNPKTAAAVYSAQGDIDNVHPPVLEISSSMDIGDYNAGRLEKNYVFTNADEVKLYKNDHYVTTLKPSALSALAHGPLMVDDTIGELLESQEGFTGRKAKLLHKALNAAAQYGIAGLPLPDLLRMGWCMLRYGLTFDDGVKLFGKYVGNWGGEAVVWRYVGLKDGKEVIAKEISPSANLHLNVRIGTYSVPCRATEGNTSSAEPYVMTEGETYDMALVRVRFLDGHDSEAAYVTTPVYFDITDADGRILAPCESPIEIAGPSVTASQGGATGAIIRTSGRTGDVFVRIRTDLTEEVRIPIEVQ